MCATQSLIGTDWLHVPMLSPVPGQSREQAKAGPCPMMPESVPPCRPGAWRAARDMSTPEWNSAMHLLYLLLPFTFWASISIFKHCRDSDWRLIRRKGLSLLMSQSSQYSTAGSHWITSNGPWGSGVWAKEISLLFLTISRGGPTAGVAPVAGSLTSSHF